MTEFLDFNSLALGATVGVLLGLIILSIRARSLAAKKELEFSQQLFTFRERLSAREASLEELNHQLEHAQLLIQQQNAALMETNREKARLEERVTHSADIEKRVTATFKGLSAEALQLNNQSFLSLAKTTLEKFQEGAKSDLEIRQRSIGDLVKPLSESLDKVQVKIQELETSRAAAYSGLTEQLKNLGEGHSKLQQETSNLVKALRAPSVRGRWGEIQLRRVVEIAGMVEYCDFVEQESLETGSGRLRPDMLIKLPSGKLVIVDSKAPLGAYLESVESTTDEARLNHLQHHAKQIRNHILQLGSKGYWDQFSPTPEFVVLFLPGETFFSAALEQDATLIEYGMEHGVILATPTTLIALLKAVAYGWRQEKLSENARAISDLGQTLYERLLGALGHVGDLRKNLERSVESYNRFIGSMESRVLVSARRFKELGASNGEDLATLEPIERSARKLEGESVLNE